MNKILAVALASAFGLAISGAASAGITGSAHDFTDNAQGKGTGGGTGTTMTETGTGGWNTRGEICRVCHVPHDHARTTQRYLNGLLWNHGVSSATYTMYNSVWSSSITGTQSAQPDGTSKLCLACHDGTVAIDTFDKYTTGVVFFGPTGYTDTGFKVTNFSDGANLDLRGTHPLSIAFPAGQTGTEFTDPAVATWANGATIASTLDAGKVQCSTCHDVHAGEAVAGTHLLRQSQTAPASGLCLTCHIK